MPGTPACPDCARENIYPDGAVYICADCGHEWPVRPIEPVEAESSIAVRDAHGTVLSDGDSVVVIKDLHVKGSSVTLKMGTKIKSIRIVDGDHEVDCRTDAGSFMLKARYLKKV